MRSFAKLLMGDANFEKLMACIDAGRCPAVLTGLEGIHRAHVAAAVNELTGRSTVVICHNELEAERLSRDIEFFSGTAPALLRSREFVFYNVESVSRQSEHERIGALYSMTARERGITVATPDAMMQRTMPRDVLLSAAFELRTGESYDLPEIAERLIAAGYKRCDQVEGVGQFAVRGGIMDFFSPSLPSPVRCEFFGDEIDSMGIFDIDTQRRTENLECAHILPVAETLITSPEKLGEKLTDSFASLLKKKKAPEGLAKTLREDIERLQNDRGLPAADRYMDLIYPGFNTAVDYMPEDAIVLLCEPDRLADRAKSYAWQMEQDVQSLLEKGIITGNGAQFFCSYDETVQRLAEWPVVMLDSFLRNKYPLVPRELMHMSAKQLPSYGGSLETAAGDMLHYLKEGYETFVLVPNERKGNILKEYLERTGIRVHPTEQHACRMEYGALSAGMEYPELKLAVLTEGQLSGAQRPAIQRKRKADGSRQRLQSYTDLSPGDLVVHEQHGIGRFVGIFKIPVDGIEKDYIKIAYAGTDSLYVPATQLDMVSKYIGAAEDHQTKLSKLGGTDWQRAKSRAKGAAKELARYLIGLYAERQKTGGYAFSPDSNWQREFEEKFEYRETDDQLRAAAEIKADMEKPVPMDRLLCGDVGYGKTEVAFRAAMKCVMDGKQVAILVPTTVLAQQHYVTAVKRFSGYPVNIDVLSRFKSAGQMRESVRRIKTGITDIVIGTHRLIQKDIVFKDLGLLIVDEEQRFGVSHKERLKELSKAVDVLTLSATPIPRTLNMALSGIRDMSVIEEPPSDRHPVQTYVLEHDWNILADAIRREVARGGQVYYLHNRVETIERTAAKIAGMLENVSVGVAHGKMDEETLGSVMEKTANGDLQVLVCTTIIETGIDIPNVNTLIIEDADKLGLAQLHQIRGRVGRSARHAFAYFTFRKGKVLTEIAGKRLAAIREFAEFNSGFKIAMRDLEIRGAGNLLGAEQSGHMLSVGYDMYLKLLEEAVLEERGEQAPVRTECSADLAVSANIPEYYVPSAEQRMDLYRRIAAIRSEEDADDLTDELIDRFGDPPKSVNTLVHVALLRGEASQSGISEISQKSGRVIFVLSDFDMEKISLLYASEQFRGRLKVEAGSQPSVSLKLKSAKNVIDEAVGFVRAYANTSQKK